MTHQMLRWSGRAALAFTGSVVLVSSASAGTHTVTTHVDSGSGSLRQAVLDANASPGPDIIMFDPDVFNGLPTIAFTSGEMTITESLTIDGPPNRVVLSGNNANRMFTIDNGIPETTIQVTFRKVRFFSGRVAGTGRGGAISVWNEQVSLIDCQMTSNTAGDSGGGIHFIGPGGSLTMTGCTVTLNTATTGGGGAISAFGTLALSITDSSFSENLSRSGGAINQSAGGSISVLRSVFFENDSNPFNGGALFLNSAFSSAVFRNATLSVNGASADGGAIALGTAFSGGLLLENCSVIGNSSGLSGGAISRLGGGAAINLTSTIVGGNGASFLGPAIFTSGTVNAAACLIQSTSGVTTFNGDAFTNSHIGVNPQVSPLAFNGGPTLTHLLQAGSPAIENGQNPADLTTDQRGTGFAREIDGDCNGVALPDIGAVEVHICHCPGDTNKNGVVNIDDLVEVITHWGYIGPPGGILADVTNDGVVNIDDLVQVITNWGPCD